MFWIFEDRKNEKQVKCDECRHYIDKEDAQKIKQIVLLNLKTITNFYIENDIFFCPMHKKNYDSRTIKEGAVVSFYKHIPEQHIEVDKNGKELKKKDGKKDKKSVSTR